MLFNNFIDELKSISIMYYCQILSAEQYLDEAKLKLFQTAEKAQ